MDIKLHRSTWSQLEITLNLNILKEFILYHL